MNEKFPHHSPERGVRSVEKKREVLDTLLRSVASSVNTELWDEFGVEFLDDSGAIRDTAFLKKFEGPYGKETKEDDDGNTQERGIKDDREIVRANALSYSGALEESTQMRFGKTTVEATLEAWHEKQKVTDPEMAEAAMMIVLHKILGENYMVMRSAQYDDYQNGVDTIVLDKTTGQVICAFDEVVSSSEDQAGERYQKKVQRSKDKLTRNGGMEIRYGITRDPETKKYTRKALRNIPAFCLPVNKKELHAVMDGMDENIDHMSDSEKGMVVSVVDAIEAQREILLHDEKKHASHITHMDSLLGHIKEKFPQNEHAIIDV